MEKKLQWLNSFFFKYEQMIINDLQVHSSIKLNWMCNTSS